ncbi:MAG TPA: hypothetical protein VK866_11580 [Acidimicrobiales bacterium]|nr:hypothetical protein [Acidimicrobiales bacterium]
MTDVLTEIILPRTDAGVLAQAIGAGLVFLIALVLVRRQPELRLLVLGIATMTAAGFGLRALH